MTEISVWARGDSSSANNASINSQGISKTPTTELTFTSGASGNVTLDYNGGLDDPDTQVIVNGVTMNFTVEFTGYMPVTNKLDNVAGVNVQGEEVAVITTEDGQRYYFLTSGNGTFTVMNAMPNGAIPVDGVVTGGGPVLVCFAEGTLIATPLGERRIEMLRAGEYVRLEDGRDMAIRWIGKRHVPATELALFPKLRPVVIPAHCFGTDCPHTDLRVSRQHRIVIEGWEVELNFGADRILVPAGHLLGGGITLDVACSEVTYFHILLETHEVLVSNGLATESFLPGGYAVAGLDSETREELYHLFPEIGGSPAMQGLADSAHRHEAAVFRNRVSKFRKWFNVAV